MVKKLSKIFFFLISAIFIFSLGVSVGQYGYQSNDRLYLKNSSPFSEDFLNNKAVPEDLASTFDFNLLADLWQTIKRDYYKNPIQNQALFYGALKGIVAALGDPYSIFLNPDESKEFEKDLAGSFTGIGAEIGIKQDRLTIIAPLSDSPAEKSGLMPGDKIFAIDKLDTTGMALDYAVSKIRGPKNTEVVLTIMHKGEFEPQEIKIIRAEIKIQSVKWEIKGQEQNIGYIKISQFNENTQGGFKKAVNEILKRKVKSLILDLRNNPGGFLDTAVDVASFWIEQGVIVKESIKNTDGVSYNARGKAILADLKTIVLINEGSASASEIVAGALQDYSKATILGEKSFGKGSVQNLQDFKDGSSLKLTIAEWLTPKGRSINEVGISPDIEVKMTYEDYNADLDPQLEKAIELLE